MVQDETDCMAKLTDARRTELRWESLPESCSETRIRAKFLFARPLALLVVTDHLAKKITTVCWGSARNRLRHIVHDVDSLD
jgi:hypothetical protein